MIKKLKLISKKYKKNKEYLNLDLFYFIKTVFYEKIYNIFKKYNN